MGAVRRLRNFTIYCIDGYKILENWRPYITDLLRWKIGLGIYRATRFFFPRLAETLRAKVSLHASITRYKLRNGTIIDTYPDGGPGMHIVFFEIYCREDYDGLANFKIQENDVVIDVGAHVGFFSLKAAAAARNGTVYAVEPCAQHFELLKHNVAQNSVKNVEVEKVALAGSTGYTLLRYAMTAHPYNTSLFAVGEGDARVEERIPTLSLDDFFSSHEISTCDLLKLDCEGSEYDILMNAGDPTLYSIKRIACEWHKFEESHQPDKLAEFLKAKGFSLVEPDSYDMELGLLYAHRPP